MTQDMKDLRDSIEANRELLIEIKDNINNKINVIELSIQKLRMIVYFAIIIAALVTGSPEIKAALHLIA